MLQDFKICFIGLGYIGLPTAAVVANCNKKVIGYDKNSNVISTVKKGRIHFVEPGLDNLVKKVVEKGLLKLTTKLTEADVYLIVVPTPLKANNTPDMSYIKDATDKIIPILKNDDLFIIESTSPVGTTEKIADYIFKKRPELKGNISVAYCPERVLPGNVIHELVNNDRVIGGIDEKSTDKAVDFYDIFVKGSLHKTNARTAEMCKLVENSYRDVNIAFANELSMICDNANINVRELISLANKHPRVSILKPGSGVGGHCIAVDPWFIVSGFPKQSKIITEARLVNNHKPDWCVTKILDVAYNFERKNGKWPIIACMGLAFKPNIDDLRESPAKYIVQKLLKSGNDDELLIVEPNIGNHSVFKLTDYNEAYKKADIVTFLVAHKEFHRLELDKNKIELDFCGVRYI